MEATKMILFAVLAAIGYGIIHDQVTAHVCVEYFSIAHPPVFPTQSPFLLALGWGVIATWWVGLPLGIGAAAASRLGPRHKLTLRDILPMVLWLLAVMAISALIAGAVTAYLVMAGRLDVPGGWAAVIPRDKWVAFSFDAGAHLASYAMGALGGLFVIARIVWLRVRLPA